LERDTQYEGRLLNQTTRHWDTASPASTWPHICTNPYTYRIRLAADQFLKAIIEQDGIDMAARLLRPDGKQIIGFDSESRLRGLETVELVAEAEGEYLMVVQPKQKAAPAGAYEIRIEELRAAHPDVADSLNNLATHYVALGDYAKAEQIHQRALAIREKSLGPEHPLTARSLNNLVILYGALRDYAKAEPLFQRALAIWLSAPNARNWPTWPLFQSKLIKPSPYIYSMRVTIRRRATWPPL
jgi:tetratricopeptide (TPR) repeat protein